MVVYLLRQQDVHVDVQTHVFLPSCEFYGKIPCAGFQIKQSSSSPGLWVTTDIMFFDKTPFSPSDSFPGLKIIFEY